MRNTSRRRPNKINLLRKDEKEKKIERERNRKREGGRERTPLKKILTHSLSLLSVCV
jgi:hypothetical protein